MYNASGQPDREQLVQRFAPLVKRIAYHVLARLPASVQVDDLIRNGMLGLLDAISRYEEGFGAQFETYATQRIRGAMLDGLRANDWLPRTLRREMRRVEDVLNRLEHEHGRVPSEQELADAMAMPLADYQRLLQEARGHQIVYYEDFSGEDGEDFFQVECPNCGETICVDDGILEDGSIDCPNCGTLLEFDFDDDCCCGDDDCDCDHDD